MSRPSGVRLFAGTHYHNTVYSLKKAREIENIREEEHESPPKPPEEVRKGRWSEHDAFVLNSIISSFSYVESHINEVYDEALLDSQAIEEGDDPRQVENDGRFYRLIRRLDNESTYHGFENNPTLKKYQKYLIYRDIEPFDRGRLPFQNMDLVRRLRNYYVHYQPEHYESTPRNQTEHALGDALEGKFDLNPFVTDSRPILPDGVLSFDGGKWVANACNEFVNEFNDRADLDSINYGDVDDTMWYAEYE